MPAQLTTIPRGSTEYLEGTVTSTATLTMGVELALARDGVPLAWLAATWTGDAGTTRTARTATPVVLGDSYPDELYGLYARLADTPEVTVIYLGRIHIPGTGTAPVPDDGWIDGGTP